MVSSIFCFCFFSCKCGAHITSSGTETYIIISTDKSIGMMFASLLFASFLRKLIHTHTLTKHTWLLVPISFFSSHKQRTVTKSEIVTPPPQYNDISSRSFWVGRADLKLKIRFLLLKLLKIEYKYFFLRKTNFYVYVKKFKLTVCVVGSPAQLL